MDGEDAKDEVDDEDEDVDRYEERDAEPESLELEDDKEDISIDKEDADDDNGDDDDDNGDDDDEETRDVGGHAEAGRAICLRVSHRSLPSARSSAGAQLPIAQAHGWPAHERLRSAWQKGCKGRLRCPPLSACSKP